MTLTNYFQGMNLATVASQYVLGPTHLKWYLPKTFSIAVTEMIEQIDMPTGRQGTCQYCGGQFDTSQAAAAQPSLRRRPHSPGPHKTPFSPAKHERCILVSTCLAVANCCHCCSARFSKVTVYTCPFALWHAWLMTCCSVFGVILPDQVPWCTFQ